MKTEIKESHSIAWGYGFFGLMWLCMIVVLISFPTLHYGISKPMEIIMALRAASDTLLYLIAMSSINILMAIAVWKIYSRPKRKQKIIFGLSFFFAIGAAVLLILAVVSWFMKKTPEWFSPFYNVYPAALLTFGYGYFAYSLRKLLKSLEQIAQADRE